MSSWISPQVRGGADISVVTVVLNCAAGLRRTLQNMRQEAIAGVEQIVVDGGSVDGTRDVIAEYAHRLARIVSEPDHGIYDALNKAVRLSTGRHICVLHAGDLFAPNGLQAVADHIALDPQAIWYADCQLGGRRIQTPSSLTPAVELYNLGIAHQALVLPREAMAAIGPYRTDFRIVSDHIWMREAYLQGWRFRRNATCTVQLDDSGLSSGKTAATRELFAREVTSRTMLYFHFLPADIARALYELRTDAQAIGPVQRWVSQQGPEGPPGAGRRWPRFLAALNDYAERFSSGGS